MFKANVVLIRSWSPGGTGLSWGEGMLGGLLPAPLPPCPQRLPPSPCPCFTGSPSCSLPSALLPGSLPRSKSTLGVGRAAPRTLHPPSPRAGGRAIR